MKAPDADMSEDGAASSDSRKRKRSRESSAEPRRTHRKTETRVFYSEVMAQEREMERINFEKSRHQQSSPTQLRKGETVESPAKRSKQKRAEERRTKRQKLRRNMSPRSPDGGPQLPLRSGVSLVNLEGDAAQLQHKRRFARDEDAIQDATLHSTAWRNLKFAEAPVNLLPDRDGVSEPFALVFDAPLEEFGDELKEKCAVSTEFLKSKPLTMMSGTRGEAKEELQVEERVKQLIEEATPLVKKCHAARANAIIAKTRQQIAAFLEQRPVMREKACTLTGLPLQISRLEKVAARRLLRDDEFATEGVIRPHYSIGRTEADHSGHVYPEVVTFLSKIAPIPRSTTANNAKNKAPQFSSMESCKDTLVGMDNEVNEYVLRYPLVKASVKLWRRVEEEQLAEVLAEEEEQDDADDEMDGEQTPESDEPMSELTPAVESTDNEDKTQKPAPDSAAVGAASTRRSSRAQTAASTKASSKKLNAIRLRKLVRSKTSDVSEYLGFDGIYQSLTQDRKSELLSADMRCGPHCCKPVSDTTQDGDIDGFSALQDKRWDDSEVALLDKLERCNFSGSVKADCTMIFMSLAYSEVVLGQCRTSECPCYFAARECDPDVCTSCGASELPVIIADEESKGKTAAQLKTCGNVNIMRGQMRKIGVSASETHGWGAYAMESVKKGEFLYEYTGSLLSQDEAERRGNVYDKTTISFLFDLNEDSVVDATRKGNKSKFANHDSGDPKCFARIMLVNGDHRIGIYAKQDITAGDELFFDYGYSGVIPDWSQSRIGSSKDTASVEEDDDNKASSVDVKEE
ncbi:hypothetical protein JG688_00012953 [Phytophthora aleatoria]|uniref:SET domain-containing protein n=1 Tax=Phytophthora aleatoria TaxID=2496075 RepID=A0A8J5J2B0_9STRA|nr:hypothetical protein JG688_00012953 [Phytophthora aleatoria]